VEASRQGPLDLVSTHIRLVLETYGPIGGVMGRTEEAKAQIVPGIVPGERQDAAVLPLSDMDQFVSDKLRLRALNNAVEDLRVDHDRAHDRDGLDMSPEKHGNDWRNRNQSNALEWEVETIDTAALRDDECVDAHTTRLSTLGSLAITFRGTSPPV
jgi:hypothetical protein